MVEYPFFLLLHAVILEPVTTSSGLRMPSRVGPRPELNVLSSIEPTVMTRRLVPGAVMLWDFGPLLPAAATTIMPSFHIFSTFFISSEVLEGLWVVPKEIFTIFIFLIAKKYLKNYSTNYNKEFIGVIGILVFIKLLDGFIYGMPSISLYNLLVFYGIMLLSIKNKKVMIND